MLKSDRDRLFFGGRSRLLYFFSESLKPSGNGRTDRAVLDLIALNLKNLTSISSLDA